MRQTIVFREVIPSIIWYLLMIVSMFVVDALLHLLGVDWISRYLGIVGTILIILSFAHSMRKRKYIQVGAPRLYLQLHELLGWIGAVLVLVHAGFNFHAFLPWAALISMLIVIASGFTGSYLLKSALADVKARQAALRKMETPDPELESQLYLDSYAVDVMKKWRTVHMPLTAVFVVLTVIHIAVYVAFWRW